MEPTGLLVILLCLWLLLALKAGFIGMSLLIQHAMPDFIERASEHYRKKPRWRINLLGIANGVGVPFISLLLVNMGILALPGILLLLGYLWMAFLAYTVVYHEFGSKLFEESAERSEFKATLYGGLVAEAAFLAPVFGQLYSIALFARSLGAVTMVILGDVVSPRSSS